MSFSRHPTGDKGQVSAEQIVFTIVRIQCHEYGNPKPQLPSLTFLISAPHLRNAYTIDLSQQRLILVLSDRDVTAKRCEDPSRAVFPPQILWVFHSIARVQSPTPSIRQQQPRLKRRTFTCQHQSAGDGGSTQIANSQSDSMI